MIQSIQRASEILALFKKADTLSLAEIAAQLDLPKTTVYGLVNTLKAEKLLEQDPETRTYYLGIGLFELASRYRGRQNLRGLAMPYLRRLADQTRNTVQLTILSGRDTVYLYKITTPNLMTFAVFEGTRAPANCTSSGKAILAYLPPERVRALFSGEAMEKPTAYSTATPEALEQRLTEARQSGYAADLQELHLGLGGVGVPVFDSTGEVCASICISFLMESYADVLREKVSLVKQTALEISLRLGCPYDSLPTQVLPEA